jgi:hypothetical protein
MPWKPEAHVGTLWEDEEATGTNLIGRSAGKELVSDFTLVRASALNLNPVIMASTARTAQAAGNERTML